MPHPKGNARMSSAMECPLRFRGVTVAAARVTPSSVQAVTVLASSRPGAGCVNSRRQVGHQVPRGRSSSGRQPRGRPSPLVSSGSPIRFGGVCRCRRGRAAQLVHSYRCSSFETNQPSTQNLYCSVQAAYGVLIMRQPNYAFERTVIRQRNHRRQRAAAQRGR